MNAFNEFFINYGGPIFFALCVVISMVFICLTPKNPTYLNSGYDVRSDKSELFLPEFKVDSIERTISKSGEWIAKYKLAVWIRTDKCKSKKIEFVLYDKIGKYNVGDILRLHIGK